MTHIDDVIKSRLIKIKMNVHVDPDFIKTTSLFQPVNSKVLSEPTSGRYLITSGLIHRNLI